MTSFPWRTPMLLLAGSALAAGAQAHPGHGAASLAAGLAHPWAGADHLLAMLAVGLWSAAVLPSGRRWQGPAAFLALLCTGALLAWAGGVPGGLEAAVAFSVAGFGALLLAGRRLPAAGGLALIGVAALLHGAAHASELQPDGAPLAYAAGFMASSALLHAAGLAAGERMGRLSPWAGRAAAALLGASGLWMLAARL